MNETLVETLKTFVEKYNKSNATGMNLIGYLTLLFVTLKLVGAHFVTPVYYWSWWLVLAPLWIPYILIFGVFIFSVTLILIVGKTK